MRILFLSQYFFPEPGAPQVRLAAVARQLIAFGHQVEVVTAVPNYPYGQIADEYKGVLYKKETWQDILIHRVWCYASQGAGVRRMFNYASFAVMCLFGLLRSRVPDYIFVESPPLLLSVPALLMAAFWRVPVIFNVSDLWPDSVSQMGAIKQKWLLGLLADLERWTYRKAKFVCAVTPGIYETLKTEKCVPVHKLLLLPNGVDTEIFRPLADDEKLRTELGLHGKSIVLYAGTHSLANDLERVLDAAKLLTIDPRIHFLFVGSGSAKRSLVGRAKELGLSNVTFLDPIPVHDVPRYFSIALCGLVSLSEIDVFRGVRPAKSLVIMACAKPLIFVAGEGAGRFIEEAGAGMVVSAREPNAIAQAIQQLIEVPPLAARYGQNGRSYVQQHLTWTTVVQGWIEQLNCASVS